MVTEIGRHWWLPRASSYKWACAVESKRGCEREQRARSALFAFSHHVAARKSRAPFNDRKPAFRSAIWRFRTGHRARKNPRRALSHGCFVRSLRGKSARWRDKRCTSTRRAVRNVWLGSAVTKLAQISTLPFCSEMQKMDEVESDQCALCRLFLTKHRILTIQQCADLHSSTLKALGRVPVPTPIIRSMQASVLLIKACCSEPSTLVAQKRSTKASSVNRLSVLTGKTCSVGGCTCVSCFLLRVSTVALCSCVFGSL